MAEQAVELAPGESKQVSFEAVPGKAKTYNVSVNGLTGSFRAIEMPILPFGFTPGTSSAQVCPESDVYWYPTLRWTVSNQNPVAVTHTLQLWQQVVSDAYGNPGSPSPVSDIGNPDAPVLIEVTLQPGGQFSYYYAGRFYYGGWYCWPRIMKNNTVKYWLQDELGNQSAAISLTRGSS